MIKDRVVYKHRENEKESGKRNAKCIMGSLQQLRSVEA